VLIERHIIIIYWLLSFDLSLMHDFNTVDFQQTAIFWHIPRSSSFSNAKGKGQFYSLLMSFKSWPLYKSTIWIQSAIFRKSKDLAISLQFHVAILRFWDIYFLVGLLPRRQRVLFHRLYKVENCKSDPTSLNCNSTLDYRVESDNTI
jgi:hypothetical protein